MMSKILARLLAWCLIASCVALLVGRIGWLMTVWSTLGTGQGPFAFETVTIKSLGFIQLETGDPAVYLLIITFVVGLVVVAYAPRLERRDRQRIASLSLIAVAFSLVMILVQIAVQVLARLYIDSFNEQYIWITKISLGIAGKSLLVLDGVPDPHYILLLIAATILLFMTLPPGRLKALFQDVAGLIKQDFGHRPAGKDPPPRKRKTE